MILDNLKKLSKAGVLSHGYILFGENESKIKKIILDFSVFLEGGEPGQLIDVLFIEPSGDNSIGIDEIRKLKNFLSVRPVKSPRRLAVISGGDAMTVQAQNALLKISEDPPEASLILISARREETFLPTLLGRFQKMHIRSDRELEKKENLASTGELAALADRFLRSDKAKRSEIIKQVVERDSAKSDNAASLFVDNLIAEISKNPVKNVRFLGVLLERSRLMASFSLNKRLQLELLSSLWYN